MTLEEIKAYLEENKDSQEVATFLANLSKPAEVNLELVKKLADEDTSIKSWLDSIKDSHANKSLETWKTNNLSKLIEDELTKRLPAEEVENMKLRELEAKISQMEKEKNYEVQRNLALSTAQSKGIPTTLVNFFVGDNDEATLSNLSILEEAYNTSLSEAVKGKLKDTSYTPPKGSSGRQFTVDDLGEMTPDQINEFFDKNV